MEVQGRPKAALAVLVVFLESWMVVTVETVADLILAVLAIVEVSSVLWALLFVVSSVPSSWDPTMEVLP